jgi:hypothetical protein
MKMYLDGNSRPGEGKVYQTKKEFEQAKHIEKLEEAVKVLKDELKFCASFESYEWPYANRSRLALKKVEGILK